MPLADRRDRAIALVREGELSRACAALSPTPEVPGTAVALAALTVPAVRSARGG